MPKRDIDVYCPMIDLYNCTRHPQCHKRGLCLWEWEQYLEHTEPGDLGSDKTILEWRRLNKWKKEDNHA